MHKCWHVLFFKLSISLTSVHKPNFTHCSALKCNDSLNHREGVLAQVDQLCSSLYIQFLLDTHRL